MRYYCVAGFVIAVRGIDNTYFNRRMIAYETEEADADIVVNYTLCYHITPPPSEQTEKRGGRAWGNDGDGYYFFDSAPDGECVALITANADWTTVDAKLLDVSRIGGAPTDIRSFNMVGEVFKYFIVTRGGVVLHSSSLIYNGSGIAFSAPSGTGKSTHTALWKDMYGDDVCVINDDSPAVRLMDGVPVIYGTPWSGKSDINANRSAPLRSVVFITRSDENKLTPLAPRDAFVNFLSGAPNPVYGDLTELTLDIIIKILESVKAYELECCVCREAVSAAMNAI